MKNKKLWMTASLICIVLGTVLTAAGRLMGGRPGFYIDRSGVHTAGSSDLPDPIQDSMTVEAFDRMEIHVDYADVELIPSDEFAVEYCVIGTYDNPICEVKDHKLTFREPQQRNSFNVGFFNGAMGAVLYTPDYYVKIKIPKDAKLTEALFDIENGTLNISALKSDTLRIADEYGNVRLGQYQGGTLDIQMENGDLNIDTINAAQTDFRNEYGGIHVLEASGGSLTAQMKNGDLIIDRMDSANTEITNSYGNIILGLPGKIDDYGLDLNTEYGDIRLGDKKLGDNNNRSETTFTSAGNGQNSLTVSCENGDIKLKSVN